MKTAADKFRCNRGLTRYAFACGYIQRASATKDGKECRVDLWHEGACYHVRAHEFVGKSDTPVGAMLVAVEHKRGVE